MFSIMDKYNVFTIVNRCGGGGGGSGGGGSNRNGSRIPSSTGRVDVSGNTLNPHTPSKPTRSYWGPTARTVGNVAGTVGLIASRTSPVGVAASLVGLAANNSGKFSSGNFGK